MYRSKRRSWAAVSTCASIDRLHDRHTEGERNMRLASHTAQVVLVHTLIALLLIGTAGSASADHGPANVTSLVVDPLASMNVYAGTADRGVLKSSDGSANWSPTGLTSSTITAVTIDAEATPATLYAGTSASGVLKSTDGGDTWTTTGLSGAVDALAIEPGAPGRVYAIVAGMGGFKSDNAGTDWSPLTPPNDVALSLAADSLTAGTIYVGTADGVYRTSDRGSTWDSLGLSGHAVSALTSLASTLFARTQHGIFKSTGGGGWTATDWMPSAITNQTPTALYAGTASGAFKSENGGDTWIAISSLTDILQAAGTSNAIGSMAVDPTDPHIVFAATQLGIFKSRDRGATWQHPVTEDCFNGIDDDGDGWSDNYDPDCPLTCLMGEPCPPGYLCNPNGFCEPTCGNGFKDGDEGDVDCGGSCSAKCQNGQTCWVGSDCASGMCDGRFCVGQTAVGAVNLAPGTVPGGSGATGTVILIAAAPAGGAVVALASSNTAAATVPGGVTVPAGSTTATFAVATSAVTTPTTVTISATGGGATRSAQLTVTPAATLTSLSVQPTNIPGGSTASGTVTLSAPAPAGGAVVTLSSANTAAATVPASVTVPSTSTTATFPVTAKAVTTSTTVTITATLGGATRTATLTVNPPPPVVTLASLSLQPTSVKGGSPSTGTVRLSAAAPTGGLIVTLSSSDSVIAQVSSITVPAGVTSKTFTISTSRPKSSTEVTISATLLGATKAATLTVRR